MRIVQVNEKHLYREGDALFFAILYNIIITIADMKFALIDMRFNAAIFEQLFEINSRII